MSVVGTAGGGCVRGAGCADFDGVAVENGDDRTGEVGSPSVVPTCRSNWHGCCCLLGLGLIGGHNWRCGRGRKIYVVRSADRVRAKVTCHQDRGSGLGLSRPYVESDSCRRQTDESVETDQPRVPQTRGLVVMLPTRSVQVSERPLPPMSLACSHQSRRRQPSQGRQTYQDQPGEPLSRMLKTSASVGRPLFGLFGLFRFWLNETNQMNQTNQILLSFCPESPHVCSSTCPRV